MSSSPHPARYLDFLSRLHDGELSPTERAHFESHRAHCAECRKAAAEFENALAAFRTAGTRPPRSDLAARILRRLETPHRRRSPFGGVFGIDSRWAGAFTAALIAVIFGYAVLDRREASQRIPISFALPTPGAPASLPSSLPPAEPQAKAPPSRPDPAKEIKENAAAPLASSDAAETKPTAPISPAEQVYALDSVSTESKARAQAVSPEASRSKVLARAKKEDPAPGVAGETAADGDPPIRVRVTALDGEGAAPDAINAPELTFRREELGRYVFVVGANGIPIEVSPFAPAATEKSVDLRRSASETLRRLRFQPGARPRRLLVSVEPAP
jgi:hypothetical protein